MAAEGHSSDLAQVHLFPKNTKDGICFLGVHPQTGQQLAYWFDVDSDFEDFLELKLFAFNSLTTRWKTLLDFSINSNLDLIPSDDWNDGVFSINGGLHPSGESVGFTLQGSHSHDQEFAAFLLVDLTKPSCPFEIFIFRDPVVDLFDMLHFVAELKSWVVYSKTETSVWILNLHPKDPTNPSGSGEVSLSPPVTEVQYSGDFPTLAFSEGGLVIGESQKIEFRFFRFSTNEWKTYRLNVSDEIRDRLSSSGDNLELYDMGNECFLAVLSDEETIKYPLIKLSIDEQFGCFTGEPLLYPLDGFVYYNHLVQRPILSPYGFYHSGCMFHRIVKFNREICWDDPLEVDMEENKCDGFFCIEIEKKVKTLQFAAAKSLMDHSPGLKSMDTDEIREATGLSGRVVNTFFS